MHTNLSLTGGQLSSMSPAYLTASTSPTTCRGRGQVVAVAAASDHVFVATSRGYVLQYSWDDYGNEKSRFCPGD
jgi:pyruvate/2-oxoacid:ferredoxin oxidoreductase beta subunit